MSLRTIVAESDEGLKNKITRTLERIEGIDVIYTADNGKDLLNVLKLMKPQIAIINTHMPELSGIKVGELIREEQPHLELIFLSYSPLDYVSEAFRLYAADFLQLPFDSKRMNTTIDRIKHKFNIIEKIVQLRLDGGYRIVKKNDIYLIEAVDKKTRIYTSTEAFICDHSLKEMEVLLAFDHFFRSSRSNIINLEKIREVKPYTRTSFEVIFENIKHTGFLSKRMHEAYKERMRNYCIVL